MVAQKPKLGVGVTVHPRKNEWSKNHAKIIAVHDNGGVKKNCWKVQFLDGVTRNGNVSRRGNSLWWPTTQRSLLQRIQKLHQRLQKMMSQLRFRKMG